MPNNKNNSNNKDWKQAVDICIDLENLDSDAAIEKLNAMSLSEEIRLKALKILSRLDEDNAVVNSNDYFNMSKAGGNDNLIGKTIDSYMIVDFIAKGGMSSVYKAEYIQSGIQKAVALKILSPYVFSQKSIELFNREQLILSKLDHPEIISFHHSGKTEDGTRYLIMEYVEGAKIITDYCKENNLSNDKIIQTIYKLANVFVYAHNESIIHRDIKATNLLIDAHGHIKVIDFGIGQIISDRDNTSTKVFTTDTAAPEQILGQNVDAQSDVFSLGAVMLQLLVKENPLPLTRTSNYDSQDDVKHISKLLQKSKLDNDLKNIIKTATHVDKDKRYANMELFAQDLNNWQKNKPIGALADSIFYRLKKFYQRNKPLSLIVFFAVLIASISLLSINTINSTNNKIQSQKENSIAMIEAVFDQANPMLNDKETNSEDLIKTFENIAKQQSGLLQSDPELKYVFYQKLGGTYFHNGIYKHALDNFELALKARKEFGSPSDEEELVLRENIYNTIEYLGDLEKAKRLTYELLADIKNIANVNPTHQLNAYNLLMKVHAKLMELEKAEVISAKAQIWMKQYPNIDQQMQSNMYATMAVIYRRTNNHKMAESMFEKAIAIKRMLKNESIGLAQIMINFGRFKMRNGDLIESEKYILEGVEILRNLDENHPALDFAYYAYSILLREKGELNESKEFLNKALSISNENNHKLIIFNSHNKMASLNLYQYDVDKAILNIMASFENKITTNGIDHPYVLDLYIQSLWILLTNVDNNLAKKVVDFVTNGNVVKNVNTKEYQSLLLLKALIERKPFENEIPESLVPQFIYGKELITTAQKITWLKNNLAELKDQNSLVAVWLLSQLTLLSTDETHFKNYCRSDAKWHNDVALKIKKMVLDVCMNIPNIKQNTNDIKLLGFYNKLNQNNAEINQLKKQLVAVLTQSEI